MQNNSLLNSNANIKPFNFQLPQSEQFNPLLLENLNWDYVQANLDIQQCKPFLKNFVQSNFTAETIRNMEFQQFRKMLEVCQFAMDFYTQNQEQKEIQIDQKVQELKNKQEQLEKLQNIEKQHNDMQLQLNNQLEQLKLEAKKAKEESIKKIIFKCHHCDKCYNSKNELIKHIEIKHTEKQKDDITNPEYLGSMLQQLQQQQIQAQQSMANTQQSFVKQQFGNTIQSLPDPLMIGSAGFQQLKQQQKEKMEAKQKRKEERKQKREADRDERIKRIQKQEEQMKEFQNSMKQLIDQKVQEMVKLNNMVGSQQQQQIIQQKKLILELEELKQMRFTQKEPSIIQENPIVNESKSKDENLLIQDEDQHENDLEISQQSLRSQQYLNDQKLLINKNQQAGDQSGMMSFHNYSYSQNSQNIINIKTDVGKGLLIRNNQFNQGEMGHIGELESDNELIEQDQEHSYLRPLNKESQVKKPEIDYIKALKQKGQQQQQQEILDDLEDDDDISNVLNLDKNKKQISESQKIKDTEQSQNKIEKRKRDK